MKMSKLSRKDGRADITFEELFQKLRYGSSEVGSEQVLFQLHDKKSADDGLASNKVTWALQAIDVR